MTKFNVTRFLTAGLILMAVLLAGCSSIPVRENENFHQLVGVWEVTGNTYPDGASWKDSHYEFTDDGNLSIHHWQVNSTRTGDRNVGKWKITRISSASYTGLLYDPAEGGMNADDIGKKMTMQYRFDKDGNLNLGWKNADSSSFSKGTYLILEKCDESCKRFPE